MALLPRYSVHIPIYSGLTGDVPAGRGGRHQVQRGQHVLNSWNSSVHGRVGFESHSDDWTVATRVVRCFTDTASTLKVETVCSTEMSVIFLPRRFLFLC